MKQQIRPQKMIDDLQRWITANREDQVWTQHQSLYLEILAQWKAVNRYRPEHGTDEDERLYNLYWSAMQQWYQSFAQQSEEIFTATPIEATDKVGFYDGLVKDLQDVIMDRIPEIEHAKIVRLTSFLNILKVSLNDMTKLQLEDLNVIDMSLLLDYWQFLGQALKRF